MSLLGNAVYAVIKKVGKHPTGYTPEIILTLSKQDNLVTIKIHDNGTGISENITVHSIVGQLLEHSRMFCFENGGTPQMYLGSADWMPRNLDRRVELVFPVEDEEIHTRCSEILELMWQDNINTRVQLPNTKYVMIDKRGKKHLNCQTEFAQLTKKALKQKTEQDTVSV